MRSVNRDKRVPVVTILIVWILYIVGASISLYPVMTQFTHDQASASITSDYRDRINREIRDNPEELKRVISSADDYNNRLTERFEKTGWRLQDPWNNPDKYDSVSTPTSTIGDGIGESSIDSGDNGSSVGDPIIDGIAPTRSPRDGSLGDDIDPLDYATYNSELNDSFADNEQETSIDSGSQPDDSDRNDGIIGNLIIPSIGFDQPIYHGTSKETLWKGIGHMFGTHLPVGGVGTHTGLAGHTGVSNMRMLDGLETVGYGEDFYIVSSGRVLKYRVVGINVVRPDEVDYLKPQPGRDLVTIVTCTPIGVNSHRLLVTGERVMDDVSVSPVVGHDEVSASTVVSDKTILANNFSNEIDRAVSGVKVNMSTMNMIIVAINIIVFLCLVIWTIGLIRKVRR